MPVFLTGDFNSPSHLDWTPAVAAVRDDVPYPFDWPVSRALADAGFRDSYREVHPDPVAVPGFTWTPGGLESDPNEVHDRIDWVLARAGARRSRARSWARRGGPDVDIGDRAVPDRPPRRRLHVRRRGRASRSASSPSAHGGCSIGDDLSAVFHGSGAPAASASAIVRARRR